MTVGRELDALISEYCLGHHVIRQKKGTMKERTLNGHIRPLRSYSTDIAAAWEVVERMGITVLPIKDKSWFAMVGVREGWENPAEFIQYLQNADFLVGGAAVEKSAPLTICLAAIKAVEKRISALNDDKASRNVEAMVSAPAESLTH